MRRRWVDGSGGAGRPARGGAARRGAAGSGSSGRGAAGRWRSLEGRVGCARGQPDGQARSWATGEDGTDGVVDGVDPRPLFCLQALRSLLGPPPAQPTSESRRCWLLLLLLARSLIAAETAVVAVELADRDLVVRVVGGGRGGPAPAGGRVEGDCVGDEDEAQVGREGEREMRDTAAGKPGGRPRCCAAVLHLHFGSESRARRAHLFSPGSSSSSPAQRSPSTPPLLLQLAAGQLDRPTGRTVLARLSPKSGRAGDTSR